MSKFAYYAFEKWYDDELGVSDNNAQVDLYKRCVAVAADILTPRELEIFDELSKGRTMKDISETFGVNRSTVSRAWKNIKRKFRFAAFVIGGVNNGVPVHTEKND